MTSLPYHKSGRKRPVLGKESDIESKRHVALKVRATFPSHLELLSFFRRSGGSKAHRGGTSVTCCTPDMSAGGVSAWLQ